MALFWIILSLLIAGTIVSCIVCNDLEGLPLTLVTCLIMFLLVNLPLLFVHHSHPIDDEKCDIAYVEHDHFLPIWEFLFFRDVHGDYDSYTCKTIDRQTITVNADHETDAVSEPEEKNLTDSSLLVYDNV